MAKKTYRPFFPMPDIYGVALGVAAGAVVGFSDINALWQDNGQTGIQPAIDWLIVALNAAAAVLIHSGGIALDHIVHLDNDRMLRPERPIPSGQMTVPSARLFYAIASGVGLLLASANLLRPATEGLPAGVWAAGAGFLFAILTAAYRLWFHDAPFFAPLLTGLRQWLVVGLGLLSLPTALSWPLIVDLKLWAPAVVVGFYAHALSWLSLQDQTGQKSAFGESIELILILGMMVLATSHWVWGAAPIVCIAVAIFVAGLLSIRKPGETTAHRLYKIGVGTLPVALSSMMLLSGGLYFWQPGIIGLIGWGVAILSERLGKKQAA